MRTSEEEATPASGTAAYAAATTGACHHEHGGKKNPKYSGTLTGNYSITKTDADHDLSKATVRLMKDGKPLKSLEFTGTPVELGADVEVIVTIGKNKTVVPASEYELHYSNNLNKGKATVIVTAKEAGTYHGSKATSFKIAKGHL